MADHVIADFCEVNPDAVDYKEYAKSQYYNEYY